MSEFGDPTMTEDLDAAGEYAGFGPGTEPVEEPASYEPEPYETDAGDTGWPSYDPHSITAYNPDGSMDVTTDYDGNGYADLVQHDGNGDGLAEASYVDTDHDGRLDTMLRDYDANGMVDQAAGDLNGDGRIDTVASDLNGDGLVDQVVGDSDYDGRPDTWLHDTNYDGHADQIQVDLDENGMADRVLTDTNYDGVVDNVSYQDVAVNPYAAY